MPENPPLTDAEKSILSAGGGYSSIQDAINYNETALDSKGWGAADPYAAGKGSPYPAKSLGYETFYPKTAYARLGFNPYLDNHEIYKTGTTKWEDFLDAQNASSQMMWNMTSMFGIGGGEQGTYAAARDYEKLVDMGSPVGKTDTFSWALKQYVQAGYTKAIITSIVAEELALAGVTAASRGKTAGAAWGRTVQNFNRLTHIGDAAGDIKKFEDMYNVSKMAKQTESARKTVDRIQDVGKARSFWNKSKAMAGSAAGAVGSAASKVGRATLPHAAGYVDAVRKGEYAMNGFANATHGFGAFWREMREFKLAFEESELEKAFIEKDSMERLTNKYRTENDGKNPTGESLENIKELANAAGASGELMNNILIYGTNKIGFNSLLTKFAPKALSESIKASKYGKLYTTKANIKKGIPAKSEFVPKGTGIKGAIGWNNIKYNLSNLKKSPLRTARYLGKASAMGATEGTQEYFQEVIQDAETSRAVKSYGKSLDGDWLDYYATSMQKFISPEGAEVFASGFFMGAFAGPHKFMVNKAADAVHTGATYLSGNYKKDNKTAVDMQKRYESQTKKLNDMFNTPWSQDVSLGALMKKRKQTEQGVEADQAIENNDENTFDHAIDDQTLETVYNAIDNGTFDVLIDQIEQMDKLSDEEVLSAFSEVLSEDASPEDIIEFKKEAQTVIDNANYIKKIKRDTDKRYINPFTYGVGDDDADTTFGINPYFMHNAFEYTKKQIVKNHYSYKRTLDKQDAILKAMMEDAPFWNKMKMGPASDRTILFNQVDLANEVSLLKKELDIAALTPSSDMTSSQKRDLKFAQDKYDLLSGYTKDVASKEEIPWKDGSIVEVDGKRYKQVTSPTKDIGKYYHEVDSKGKNIPTGSTKKEFIENKMRKGMKGTKEKVPGIQELIEELRLEYRKDDFNNKLKAEFQKKMEEGSLEGILDVGMPVILHTKNGGKGRIVEVLASHYKIKKDSGHVLPQVLKSNVSIDKEAALNELFKDSQGEANEVVTKLWELYKNYMILLSKKNGTQVDEANLEKSFNKFLDFYALDADGENMTQALNLLMNPRGFEASRKRRAVVEEHIWNNKKEIIAESLKIAYENKQLNFLLTELASKHNVFILEELALKIQDQDFKKSDLRTADVVFYDKTNLKPVDDVSKRHQSAMGELVEYLDKRWKKEDVARTEYKVGDEIRPSDVVDEEIANKIKIANDENKKAILETEVVDNQAKIKLNDEILTVKVKEVVKQEEKAPNKTTKKATPAAKVAKKQVTSETPFEEWESQELKDEVQALFDKYKKNMREKDDIPQAAKDRIEKVTIDEWLQDSASFGKAREAIKNYNTSIKEAEIKPKAPVKIPKAEPPENKAEGDGPTETRIDHPIAELKLPMDIINDIISGKVTMVTLDNAPSTTQAIVKALNSRDKSINSMKDATPDKETLVTIKVKGENGVSYDVTLSYAGKMQSSAPSVAKNKLELAQKLGLPTTSTGIYTYPVKIGEELTFYASSSDQAAWFKSGSQHVFMATADESYQEPTKNEDDQRNDWINEITDRLNKAKTLTELDMVYYDEILMENDDSDIVLGTELLEEMYQKAASALEMNPNDFIKGDAWRLSDIVRNAGITGENIIGVVAEISNDSVTFTLPYSENKTLVVPVNNLAATVVEKINLTDMNEEISKKGVTLTPEETEAILETNETSNEVMDDANIKSTLDKAEKSKIEDVRNDFWNNSINKENC